MRLHTFDVFDTLLTRTLAVPKDLFLELGEDLCALELTEGGPERFASLREKAEIEARRQTKHGEPGLEEIYAVLSALMAWDPKTAGRVMQLELDLEESAIRPVPGMLERVEKARRDGDGVAFLSDMYLPGAFIRGKLRKAGFLKNDKELYLSSEIHASKWTGEMYERVRSDLGPVEAWTHVGDHPQSDVQVPAGLGISASLFERAHPTRFEALTRMSEQGAPILSRSRLAGAMRLARLENPEQDAHRRVVWDTASSVIGPLLFGFVQWCLDQAETHGIKRLYFVSRDGQILHRMARKIADAWGYDIECRYLFGSRQAWHPAAVGRLDPGDLEWILTPTTFLSVNRVFDRVGMKPEAHARTLEEGGFARGAWDENLDEESRARLGRLILEEPLKSAVENEAASKRDLALEYMRQEGLLDGTPWAMADIGWHGRLQDSLTKLLRRASEGVPARMAGFYFGLVGGNVTTPEQLRVGFWNDPDGGERVRDLNLAMIEIFTAADHGPVIGYESRDGNIGPILMRPRNEEALAWGLEIQHRSVLRFAERLLESSDWQEFSAVDFRAVTEKPLECFCRRPTRLEAQSIGAFPFTDDQYASSLKPFLPRWNCVETMAAIFQRRRRPPFWWHEGSLALRPCLPLWLYVNLRRLKRRLCN